MLYCNCLGIRLVTFSIIIQMWIEKSEMKMWTLVGDRMKGLLFIVPTVLQYKDIYTFIESDFLPKIKPIKKLKQCTWILLNQRSSRNTFVTQTQLTLGEIY